MGNEIREMLIQAQSVLNKFTADDANIANIARAADLMCDSLSAGGKIISCGNGGSLCDATHFAEELTARFRKNRRALAAVAINDAAFITCAINDFDPKTVFARYVEAIGNQGDVLLAISTSGNSANIVNAVLEAKKRGIKVVALTGNDGGELCKLADVEIRAPHTGYSDRIQEIHIKVIHILVQTIENRLIYAGS